MASIKRLWQMQEGKCYFCDCETHLRKNGGPIEQRMATIEHMIPKSRGGSNLMINLKMSCYDCNNSRGDMEALTWYEIVNSPKKLKAFRRARLLRKTLAGIRKKKKRAVKLFKKYGEHWEQIALEKKRYYTQQKFGVAA